MVVVASPSQADKYEVTATASPEYTVNTVPSLVVLVKVDPTLVEVIGLGTVSQLVDDDEMTVEEKELIML